MFKKGGVAKLWVPKFGYAVEAGKGMLSFPADLLDSPQQSSYVYPHFEPIKSYANRLCRTNTVKTDCPPAWQCCEGGNHMRNDAWNGHCAPKCVD